MDDSHSWVYIEGPSGKWKLRMNLLCRFCSCLQVWNPIIWSLRNDVRAVSFHILFHPRIQAGHWKESHAFLRFSFLGSNRCYGVFPRQMPCCSHDMSNWHCVKQMEFPFEKYFLPCMFVLKMWVLGHTEDRGKRRHEKCERWVVWEVRCSPRQSGMRQMGNPCNFHGECQGQTTFLNQFKQNLWG